MTVNFDNFNGSYCSWPTTIGGNLSVTQGNGSQDQVNFGVSFGYIGSNSTFSGSTTIGGNLSVLQGSGTNDEVNLGVNFYDVVYSSSFSGATTVGGNVTVTQGDGSQDQNDVVNFGVNYGYINSSSFSCPTKIGGNLSVSTGQRQPATRCISARISATLNGLPPSTGRPRSAAT